MPYSIIVICDRCFSPCPIERIDQTTGYPIYRLSEPCPRCGSQEWVSHDINLDPKTGRSLDSQ